MADTVMEKLSFMCLCSGCLISFQKYLELTEKHYAYPTVMLLSYHLSLCVITVGIRCTGNHAKPG